MIEHPVYRSSYHLEVLSPEGVFLLSEHGHAVLKGELHCHLAPLLDGRRTADDIVDALSGVVDAAEVYYTLALLEEKGYVVEADASVSSERAAFWHAVNADASGAEHRLANTTARIVTVGRVPREAFVGALASLGMRVDDHDADFTVVLTDDYLHDGIAAVNSERLARGGPWMLAKPVGAVLWIGPVFRPGHTACWECLAHRLRANREVEQYLQQKQGRTRPFPVSTAVFPAAVGSAAQLVAVEVAKALAQEPVKDERDDGYADTLLVTLDLTTLNSLEHHVVRRPQCAACGDATYRLDREPAPIVLESRKKRFTTDGGHRAVSPKETIKKYERHVSPITGAVRDLIPAAADDDGMLTVFTAGHNQAFKWESLQFLRQGIRSNSGGKGMTEAQAKASALCEAIERYSGNFHSDEIRTRATFRELGERAIHPNACMLFSEKQFEQRDEWNARRSRFELVTIRFDEDAELDWTPVWSLTAQDFKYLPTGYCYYGHPESKGSWYFYADSNGNASGNTLEEAVLQGFLELVERDAVALWWYNRVRRPAVDLDTFDDHRLADMREIYRKLGRRIWVLDITTDLGIPAFAAISAAEGPTERIVPGFGAHFDPKIGVQRALTEVNQGLVVAKGFEEQPEEYDNALADWWHTATLANQPYLVPLDSPLRRAVDFGAHWSDDFLDDVLRCQRIVEAKGMEMLVLDQTRPDLQLPVAKVFVPGLRHFWARFAAGRLYDVPAALGWVERPLTEDELNPVAMFM